MKLACLSADMAVTAIFCPGLFCSADQFRKSALSQLEFALGVGSSKKWGVTMHSPVLNKGTQTSRGLPH